MCPYNVLRVQTLCLRIGCPSLLSWIIHQKIDCGGGERSLGVTDNKGINTGTHEL